MPHHRRRREPDSEDETSSESEQEQVESVIPAEGIEVEALAFYCRAYVDRGVSIKPEPHPRDRDRTRYRIRATASLSAANVDDIREDSRAWKREKRNTNATYTQSQTVRARVAAGATVARQTGTHLSGVASTSTGPAPSRERQTARTSQIPRRSNSQPEDTSVVDQLAALQVGGQQSSSTAKPTQASRHGPDTSTNQARPNISQARATTQPTVQRYLSPYGDHEQPADDPKSGDGQPSGGGTQGWPLVPPPPTYERDERREERRAR